MSGNHLSPPDAPDDGDLLLAVEAAEAEAEAAEASAAAARARARAAQLRHRAAAGGSTQHERSGGSAASTPDGTATAASTGGAAAPGADTPISAEATTATSPTADAEPSSTADADETSVLTDDSVLTDNAVSADSAEFTGTDRDDRKQRLRRLRFMPRISRRAAGVTVAVVVLCAGLGGSGYMMWRHHDVTAQQHREAEFVAAARQGVTSLTSLDFNHAADDVKRVIDDSTGTFRDDFRTRADDFAKVIQQSKVATEGRVNSAAVQSMTGDSAVVLVAATSKVTNSAGAKQEPRAWRLSVTVERVDGQLKMSKVEFVP